MDSIPMHSDEVVEQLRQRLASRHEVVYDNAKHRVDKSLTIDFAISNQSTHIERKFKMMSAQEIYSTYRCARDEAGTLQAVELYRFVHYPVSIFAAFTDVSRLVEVLPDVMASEDNEKLMIIISKQLYKSIVKICNKRDGLKMTNTQANQLVNSDEIRGAEKVSLFENKFSIVVFTTHENRVLANVAMDALDANLPNLKKALKACIFGKGSTAAVRDPVDGTESHADDEEQRFVISVRPMEETKTKTKAGNKLLYLLGVRPTPESKRKRERVSITSEESETPTEFVRQELTEQVAYEPSSARPSNADSVESVESKPRSWTKVCEEQLDKKNCDGDECVMETAHVEDANEEQIDVDELFVNDKGRSTLMAARNNYDTEDADDEEEGNEEEHCVGEDENSEQAEGDDFEEQASDAEYQVECDAEEQDAGIESDADEEIVESVIPRQDEGEVCNAPPRRPSSSATKTDSRASSRRASMAGIEDKLGIIDDNNSRRQSVVRKMSIPRAMDNLSEPEEQKKVADIVKVYEQLSSAVGRHRRANENECAKPVISNTYQCARSGSASAFDAGSSNVTTARWQSSVPAQVVINVEVTSHPEKANEEERYTVNNIVWQMNNERPRTLKEALRTLGPAQRANNGKGAGNKTVILDDVPRREGAYPVLSVPRCTPHLAAVRSTAPVVIEQPAAAMMAAVDEQVQRRRDECVVLTHPRFLSQKVAENQAKPTACTPAPTETPVAPQQEVRRSRFQFPVDAIGRISNLAPRSRNNT